MLQGAGISAWSRPSAAAFATSPWADAVSGRIQLTLRELAESLQRGSWQQCANFCREQVRQSTGQNAPKRTKDG
jgi:hypothetical protein